MPSFKGVFEVRSGHGCSAASPFCLTALIAEHIYNTIMLALQTHTHRNDDMPTVHGRTKQHIMCAMIGSSIQEPPINIISGRALTRRHHRCLPGPGLALFDARAGYHIESNCFVFLPAVIVYIRMNHSLARHDQGLLGSEQRLRVLCSSQTRRTCQHQQFETILPSPEAHPRHQVQCDKACCQFIFSVRKTCDERILSHILDFDFNLMSSSKVFVVAGLVGQHAYRPYLIKLANPHTRSSVSDLLHRPHSDYRKCKHM